MKINEPIKHDTAFPPTASAGPDNAYYLRHCAEIERGPAYTACLARLNDIDAGRSNERTAQCEKAVRENRCVAKGMREQEQLAGAALFYFPRLNKPFLPAAVAGDFGVLITNLTDPALIPKNHQPKPTGAHFTPTAPAKTLDDRLTDATTNGFAEAISAAVAEAADTSPAPAPKPVPAPTPAPKPTPAAPAPVQAAKPARPPMLPGETPLQYARRLAAQSTTA